MKKNQYLKHLSRKEKNKLSVDEKAAAALELLMCFDFRMLKKQREQMLFLSESGLMPKKVKDTLDGLDNGLYELAAFSADYLNNKETDVLLVEPNHKSQKASDAWHKKNNAYCDREKKKIVEGIKKNINKKLFEDTIKRINKLQK